MEKIDILLPSTLFPFRLSDLAQFHYQRYTLTNVFNKMTPQQQAACVDLWLRNRVIPTADAAWARTAEVCYFITETATGNLVGVNTLYLDRLTVGGPPLFLNRMFIDPKYRNSRLMITGTAMMLIYAKTTLDKVGVTGVVNVNENTKLSRPGMKQIFTRLGYRQVGQQHGQEVLYYEFARINIIEAQ